MDKRARIMDRLAAVPDELLPEIEQSIAEIEDWHKDLYHLSEAEREAVEKGLAAARAGDFVPPEEITELRERHRR